MKKTKKIVLFISGIFFLLLIISLCLVLTNCCGLNKNLFKDIYTQLAIFGFLFPLILIFSLITYFLKDEIFKPWLKFTYIWLPLSIIFTLITPGGSGSFFVSLWDKEMTVIFMSGLYVVVSITMLIINVIRFYFINKNKTDTI
jgi:hypothetical protein